MKLLMNLRIKKAAIKVLRKKLGWGKLIKVLPGLSKRQKLGEPWKGLAEPIDQKDKDSRALIGEAILLYRELLNMLTSEEAEQIIREVIIESAVMQLYSLIPKISKDQIMAMTPDARREKFCGIVEQFPNADWVMKKASEDEFEYSITRCRLVELIIEVGHPELADAFCMGDGIYFDRHQPDILLTRDTKIGSNDDTCNFNFKIK